MGFGLGFT